SKTFTSFSTSPDGGSAVAPSADKRFLIIADTSRKGIQDYAEGDACGDPWYLLPGICSARSRQTGPQNHQPDLQGTGLHFPVLWQPGVVYLGAGRSPSGFVGRIYHYA